MRSSLRKWLDLFKHETIHLSAVFKGPMGSELWATNRKSEIRAFRSHIRLLVLKPILCFLLQHSLVLFAQQQVDVVELRPFCRLLGPAALHQLTQLRTVALGVDGRSEAGPLAQNHPVHDLCKGRRASGKYQETWTGNCLKHVCSLIYYKTPCWQSCLSFQPHIVVILRWRCFHMISKNKKVFGEDRN